MRKGFLLLSYCAWSSLIVSCAGLDSSSASSQQASSSTSSSSISSSSSTGEQNSSSTQDLLNFTLNISGNGTVSGTPNGQYEYGTSISLSATPSDEDYYFAGYYDSNDIQLSSNANYSFTLVVDTTIVAKFDSNIESYYHKFSVNELKANLPYSIGSDEYKSHIGDEIETDEINGLRWTYTIPTYMQGATLGVQIGSKAQPQTSDWKIYTDFGEEVTIVSYEIEIANASGGSGTYSVSFGDYASSGTFAENDIQNFGEGSLNYKSSSFELTLKANSKAMYLYSISLDAIVPENSSLDLQSDGSTPKDPLVAGEGGIPALNYTLISKDEYYKDIDLNETGTDLVSELNSLISAVGQTSYEDAKTMLIYTDEDPANPGYIYSTWTGDDLNAEWDGGSWNREHIWPYSFMGRDNRPNESEKSIATDLHNLRAADSASNEYHGNSYYYTEQTSTTFYPNIAKGTLPGHHAYSGDFRGDTARIVFYMYVRYYPTLSLVNGTTPQGSTSLGDLATLLDWNTEDPVDEFETQRNNRIFEYQGNRNPFVDYPDLANEIWE